MTKALIYTRVSGRGIPAEEKSVQSQIKICTDFIENYKNFLLTENGIYTDIGSSSKFNRPGLTKLLLRIKTDNAIGAIAIENYDRLSRKFSEILKLQKILKKHNVKLLIAQTQKIIK